MPVVLQVKEINQQRLLQATRRPRPLSAPEPKKPPAPKKPHTPRLAHDTVSAAVARSRPPEGLLEAASAVRPAPNTPFTRTAHHPRLSMADLHVQPRLPAERRGPHVAAQEARAAGARRQGALDSLGAASAWRDAYGRTAEAERGRPLPLRGRVGRRRSLRGRGAARLAASPVAPRLWRPVVPRRSSCCESRQHRATVGRALAAERVGARGARCAVVLGEKRRGEPESKSLGLPKPAESLGRVVVLVEPLQGPGQRPRPPAPQQERRGLHGSLAAAGLAAASPPTPPGPGAAAWSKCSPWQCPGSAPVAPQGAPGSSERIGTSGAEARPLGAKPLPWVLERAASSPKSPTSLPGPSGPRRQPWTAPLRTAVLAAPEFSLHRPPPPHGVPRHAAALHGGGRPTTATGRLGSAERVSRASQALLGPASESAE